MDELIAICGLHCDECGALIATLNNDNEKRAEVAKTWSELFKKEFKPEDINCNGCTSVDGELFNYCNICEIRKCGMEKGVINCAYCDEYGCDKLVEFFKLAPESKKSLEEIRAKM